MSDTTPDNQNNPPPAKRRRGRPVGYRKPNPKTENVHAILTQEDKALYLSLGGTAWLERKLAEERAGLDRKV
jgi:hypothetical protein